MSLRVVPCRYPHDRQYVVVCSQSSSLQHCILSCVRRARLHPYVLPAPGTPQRDFEKIVSVMATLSPSRDLIVRDRAPVNGELLANSYRPRIARISSNLLVFTLYSACHTSIVMEHRTKSKNDAVLIARVILHTEIGFILGTEGI